MKPGLGLGVAVTLVVLAAVGCEEGRENFDLDGFVESSSECVTVVHESLELGGTIHQFVGDGLGSPGGWGLVTLDDVLSIVRVPASATEPPTEPIGIGLPEEFADVVSLRIGIDSELWVLLETDSISLVRMVPGSGEVARNDALQYFPAFEFENGCPSAHSRSLLLIDGQPYLLALPNCASGPALSLHLLSLRRETLEYLTAWELAFDPCDGFEDPVSCALVHAYVLETIGPPGVPPHSTLERVTVGFTQVRAFSGFYDAVVRRADISLLDMRMTEMGPHARLVSYREVWTDSLPFSLGSVDVTRDPYSAQLHVRNELHDDDAALVRIDTIAEEYSLLTDLDQLPLGGRGRLVQLSSSGAMLDVEDGALRGVELRGWPSWSTHTLLELPDLVDFEVSGIGQLLLRREESPPQVVHVTCVR